MTLEQIQTFLAVIDYGSVSKASEHLFTSQPALTQRLNELEKELNVELFEKNKSGRTPKLTAHGNDFVLQARKWRMLWEETTDILHKEATHSIRISACSSFAPLIFPKLYPVLTAHGIPMNISMKVQPYTLAYRDMEDGLVDFVLNSYPMNISHIEFIPLAQDRLVFISRKELDYPNVIDPAKLDVKKEIRMSWGTKQTEWWDKTFGSESKPMIETNNMSLTEHLLRELDSWAIISKSSASTMFSDDLYKISAVKNPPPNRILYISHNLQIKNNFHDIIMNDIKMVTASIDSLWPLNSNPGFE